MDPGLFVILSLEAIVIVPWLVWFVVSQLIEYSRGRTPKVPFHVRFNQLLEQFGLTGKADVYTVFNGPKHRHSFTILRIADNDAERSVPLPLDFILRMRSLILKCYAWRAEELGYCLTVDLGQALTPSEREKKIADWEAYCRQYYGD